MGEEIWTRLKWDVFKTYIDAGSPFKEIKMGTQTYRLLLVDGEFKAECFIHRDGDMPTQLTDYETNYQSLRDVLIDPRTSDGLPTHAVNRIPFGYSVYPTGVSDDRSTGTFGGGSDLIIDKDNKSVDFCLINNWYAIGGMAEWDDKSQIRDYIEASLVVPATNGTNGSGYDFTKTDVGGFNMYIPTAAGAGDWDLDLTNPAFSGKELLQVNLVPSAGNTGFFDYNKLTNQISVNASQQGGYNLFDVELTLFKFGRKLWAPHAGGGREFKEPDVVGKLLYANWCIRFNLNIYDEANRVTGGTTPTVAMNMITAAKQNI